MSNNSTPAPSVDYSQHVDKKFTSNATGETFAVKELKAAFDLGARRGGKKDCYVIVRESDDHESIRPAAVFLKEYTAVTETITETVEVPA